MFNTLEKDHNYGVSQMNAFSVLSHGAELIYIQEYRNYGLTGKAGKEQLDIHPKHLTGKQEADHSPSLSSQNFTKPNINPIMVCFKKLHKVRSGTQGLST